MYNIFIQIENNFSQSKQLYKRIFISTFIIGVFTHLFVFVNKFYNNDDIAYIGRTEVDHLSTGRWFLNILTKLSSDYSMPWVIGILSLFFLALTAVVLCSILQTKNFYSGTLIGGLLVTYPSNAGNFGYMFLADGYSEGIFLSVLGVYFLRSFSNCKRDSIIKGAISAFCLALSLSVYQAYFCIAIGLILICLISDCTMDILDSRLWINTLKKGIRYLAVLTGALSIYLITVFISLHLTGTQLSSYQNINNAATLSFESLIQGFYNAYKNFILFIQTKDFGNYNSNLFAAHLGMVITSICLGGYTLYRKLKPCIQAAEKTEDHIYSRMVNIGGGVYKNLAILFLLILLLPAAIESIYLIASQGENLHLLTKYSRVLWYIVYVKLMDGVCHIINKKIWYKTAALITAVTIFQNYLVCNICYYRMQITYNSVYSMLTRMAVRIEESPGFTYDSVVWVAADGDNPSLTKNLVPGFSETRRMTGISKEGDLMLSEQSIYNMMRGSIHLEYQIPEEKQRKIIVATKQFADMPIYPAEGSVQWIKGTLVVKISDWKEDK